MNETQNSIVKKSNKLINAHFQLGINEQKVLYQAISMIHYEDKNFKDYEIKIVDIIKFLDVKNKNIHSDIKKYTRNLLKQVLIIREDDEEIQINWLSYVHYKNNNEFMFFSFHPKLKPYLLDLKNKFTRYGIENIRRLKNKYSPRVYEMLKQFEDTGYRIIKVSELKKILGIENLYKKYADFKRNVLITPQSEINNNTDLFFTFTEIKEGKMVDRIHFDIGSKSKNNKNISNGDSHKVKENIENEDELKTIDLSNDKLNNLKSKIKEVINDEIKDNKILQWVESGKEREVDFYLDNWSKWEWKTKTTKAGFFIDLVDNNRPIPSGEKGVKDNSDKPQQSLNYEQRVYTDEDFNSWYDNVKFVKE